MERPFRAGAAAPLPKSLWAATTPPWPSSPELERDHKSPVVVVGAGFMGLSAALRLAERGIDVMVLEAAVVGWGASGRNNGLVAAGLKRDPWEVRRILGAERAERLLRFSGMAPQALFELCERYGIDCDLKRRGWIQAAHARRALPLIERRVAEWQALGVRARMIANDALAERLGSDYFAGAWYDPRGGSLNPLTFVRGLARAAAAAGASIHESSPVIGITRVGGRWQVQTPQARVSCEHLIWCTNAYAVGRSDVAGTVLPLRTAQIASVPLAPELAATILPGGESCSDTRRLLTSFRLTADRRLIMGGASATAGDEHDGLFRILQAAARDRFPQLGDIAWEYGWSGYLALTPDHLPQILRLGDGYYAGVACNGRGIAMATATGTAIADLVCGADNNDCSVPVRKPRRFFGYGLRHLGVAGGVRINRLFDTLEHRAFG